MLKKGDAGRTTPASTQGQRPRATARGACIGLCSMRACDTLAYYYYYSHVELTLCHTKFWWMLCQELFVTGARTQLEIYLGLEGTLVAYTIILVTSKYSKSTHRKSTAYKTLI